MPLSDDDVESTLRALASERRLMILKCLKAPKTHFRPQVDGDLVKDGVCGVLIAEKLGVSQPTVSEHLKVLSQAGFLRAKRVKQWTFYKRDEVQIAILKKAIVDEICFARGPLKVKCRLWRSAGPVSAYHPGADFVSSRAEVGDGPKADLSTDP